MNAYNSIVEGPLERVRKYGVKGVSASDLMSLAVSNSESDISTNETRSLEWIQTYGVRGVTLLSASTLNEISGLSRFESHRILCAIELGRRASNAGPGPITEIGGPADVARFFDFLFNEKQEYFCAIFLNSKNGIIASRTIHIGTINSSLVGSKEVFREAIREGANAVIVVHNHPSGDPNPSPEDILTTKKLSKAGRVLDIPLLDHVILGDHCFISMSEKGML